MTIHDLKRLGALCEDVGMIVGHLEDAYSEMKEEKHWKASSVSCALERAKTCQKTTIEMLLVALKES